MSNPVVGRIEQLTHTPGPWRTSAARLDKDATAAMEGRVVEVSAHGWAQLAVVAVEHQKGEANARLIAAAPDLLAAAKAVFETCPVDYDINARWQATWDALVAAIAKAEGKDQ